MRCGIQFPVEKEGKKGKGKNEEISFCFICLSSLFSTAVCGPKGRREKGSKE
jgi:hypothetical protein